MGDFLSDMVEIAQVQDPADLFSMVSPEPGFWSRSITSFTAGPWAELLKLISQCLYCGKVPKLLEIQTSGAVQHHTNQLILLACIQSQSSSVSALLVSSKFLQFLLARAQK